jgi:ribosomal protein L17
MTNDKKDILMQYLYRFADHFTIENAHTVSFKKRQELMAALQQKDHNAWVIVNNLFETFIKADRIDNDKEKFDKARPLWEKEHAEAEKDKVQAEMLLIDYCKKEQIQVGAQAV